MFPIIFLVRISLSEFLYVITCSSCVMSIIDFKYYNGSDKEMFT